MILICASEIYLRLVGCKMLLMPHNEGVVSQIWRDLVQMFYCFPVGESGDLLETVSCLCVIPMLLLHDIVYL